MTVRPDGRSETSIRPLSCELSTLRDANGSAIWKSGDTTVLASCHGPTAPRQAQSFPVTIHDDEDEENVDNNSDESNVLVQVLLPGSLRHSSEWEIFLTNVLTGCIRTSSCPHNSVIQVVLQVPSDDGSVLSACVHAAVSALMDASVELNYLPVAITCVVSPASESENPRCGLDPTAHEEWQEHSGLLTMIVVPPRGGSESKTAPRLGGMHTSGILVLTETILTCWAMSQEAANTVTAFWRMVLTHKHQRHAGTLFAGAGS